MKHQHIIHRMIMDEIVEFREAGLRPNTIVMSSNILFHMLQWKNIQEYYVPGFETRTLRATYCGLTLVEAQPEYSKDKTRTPGVCFVCCAASSGKLNNILENKQEGDYNCK